MRRFALLVGLLVGLLAVGFLTLAGLTALGAKTLTTYASQEKSYSRAAEAMPALLALEREKVTFLRTQDWCQAYNDGSGVRSNTLKTTCTITDELPARTFDAETRARYDELARLTAGMPYRMNQVEISYDGNGHIARAEIALDTWFSRESLIYDPGYSLPALRGEGSSPDILAYTAIDADWYHLLEDWL